MGKRKLECVSPPLRLLCKIASIVGHAEEFASDTGHPFDEVALRSLIGDSEVQCWMQQMRSASLAPLPRYASDRSADA